MEIRKESIIDVNENPQQWTLKANWENSKN